MIVFLLTFFHTSCAWAETPLLSSKAVRISLKAKQAIDGHDEKAMLGAVQELQELLRESSFRRLEPQAQVHILLLLSKGFERLEKYKEQEQLLFSCAKREELYRFQVPLKTALARSYIQQHRLSEADHILSKIIKSSCAHLPLEEKGAIANVLVYRDEYLHYLLRQGDKLAEKGKWEEALKLYDTVLDPIDREEFPYQSSSVEKRRLRQKLLLRCAEAHFCLGNFEKTVSTLQGWEEPLFFDPSDQPLLTRRLFLIASAYQKMHDTHTASTWFCQYFSSPYLKRPFLDRHVSCSPLQTNGTAQEDTTLSPALLLWKAQEALQAPSPALLLQSTAILQKKLKTADSITHILQGFHAYLEHNLPMAVQELTTGLAKPPTALDCGWREASFHLLAECGFERMMLLVCSNQQKKAEEMAQQLVPLFPAMLHPNTLLRIGAIHLFLYKATLDPSQFSTFQALLNKAAASKQPCNPSLLTLLTSNVDPPSEPAPEAAREGITLSASDRFFATWLGVAEPFADEPERIGDNDIGEAPFSRYRAALFTYSQAMADEVASDLAVTELHQALESVGLEDPRPQLIHCLVDLAIHTSQWAEADKLVNDLIKGYPTYPSLPQAVLSCIFAFEEVPFVATERLALCQYIFDRQKADIHTLLLTIHLFETRQQLTFGYKNISQPLGLALIARSEARNLVAEAMKSKEPSVIKERVQGANKAFDTCRTHALETLETLHDPESSCCIWGLIFGAAYEQIEVLERYIASDSAFNELPSLLEEAGSTLRQDLAHYASSIHHQSQYISAPFLDSCLCLSHSADLYAKTFRRDLEGALVKTKDLPQNWHTSRCAIRSCLYLSKALRESNRSEQAMALLLPLQETKMSDDYELALEIAMEKSLCLRELHHPDEAMALLAWVINGPYASSLRVKAMILRADVYFSLHRTDLAIRQLESVAAKGGEWGAVADRKLKEFYGTDD